MQLKPQPNTPNIDPRAYLVQSNEKGDFLFDAIDPGIYTLSATKPGYLPFKYGATRATPAPKPFPLAPGKPVTDIVIQLTPAAAISGKVLDDDGDPAVAYVQISRERYEDGVRKLVDVSGVRAEADGDGRYRISGLEAGRYYVTARAPGPEIPFVGGGYATVNGAFFAAVPVNAAARPATAKSDYASTFYPNAIDQRDAKPIDIAAGQELTDIDIRMRKAEVFSVRGRIEGAIPGHPVDQYRIALVSPSRTSGVVATLPPNVGPDGSFELVDIPPGEYNLTVESGGVGQSAPLAMQRISVTNHDATGILFSLKAPGSISGSVTKPAVGITITLTSESGPRVKVKSKPTKDTGQYQLADIPPGTYRMAVEGNPDGTYLKSPDLPLEVTPGPALDQVPVILGQAGRLTGTAPARSVVTLVPDPPRPDRPELYKQTTSDDDGQFDLKNVTPGTYRLYAWDDIEPGAWFDIDFLKRYTGQSVAVSVSEGGSEQVKLPAISTQTPIGR